MLKISVAAVAEPAFTKFRRGRPACTGFWRGKLVDFLRGKEYIEIDFIAAVAELVDAHVSGACIRKDVGVRLPPAARKKG